MPVDHFSIWVPTPQFEPLVSFLTSSLSHMGYKDMVRMPHVPALCGMGDHTGAFMWIAGLNAETPEEEKALKTVLKRQHTAFVAESKEQVDKFYDAAIKAGGVDNGKPGPRPQFGPKYYAAFAKDPVCGINFEVVYRKDD